MAAGDITIRIDSETKAFKQGVEAGIIEPLEDADQALTDLGKNRGPDQLEKGMKEAQTSTEKLGRETKQVADQIEREFRDSYRKVARSADEGFGKAKASTDEFKREANSTARESAASFDGSAESIAESFQEVAANAFAGFGPAGAAAGIAVAIGLGTVLTALSEQQAALDALKEKFAGVYRQAAEDGRTYLDEAQIQSGVLDILFDPERAKAARKEAALIGVDVVTVARAQAGSAEDIAALIEVATSKAKDLNDAQKDATGTTSIWAAGVQSVVTKYEAQRDLMAANEKGARDAAASVARGQQQAREEAQKTVDVYQQLNGKTATVKIKVDDSDVRNYRPPTIHILGRVVDKYGREVI